MVSIGASQLCRVASLNRWTTTISISSSPNASQREGIKPSFQEYVPEMNNSDDVCYNPFKPDIYQFGTTMLDEFGVTSTCYTSSMSSLIFQTYTGLGDFKPLLHGMVSVDPDKRPSASDALAQFDAIVSRSSKVSTTWRIWPIDSVIGWSRGSGFGFSICFPSLPPFRHVAI